MRLPALVNAGAFVEVALSVADFDFKPGSGAPRPVLWSAHICTLQVLGSGGSAEVSGSGLVEQARTAFFLEPKALALDVDGARMVEQAVEDCAGDDRIAKHLAPRAQTLIAGDDDRAAFVAARNQLEKRSLASACGRSRGADAPRHASLVTG